LQSELDFSFFVSDKEDVLGEAYMYLIESFCNPEQAKKGGEFFTTKEVSPVTSKLVAPKRCDLFLTRLGVCFIDSSC